MSLENKEVPDVKSGVSSPVLDEDKTLAANFHQASDNSNLEIEWANNFKLFAEDENIDGFIPEIKVNVENPQRHAEPLDTYITYKITVSSNRADFAEKEYIVRRRYNDFVWLRNKLVETYPTRLIPPLPGKHSLLGHLDRYAKDFIALRMIMLNRFLNRVIKHPILSYSEHLKTFLTASISEFISCQKSTSSGLFTKMSGSFQSMTMTTIVREKYSEFEEMKKYIANLSEKLIAFEKIMSRMHKERKELTKDMNQLGIEFEKWGNCEIILSPLLMSVGQAFSKVSVVHETLLTKPMEFVLLQPIREYISYTESVKEALMRRDNVQIQYESAVDEIYRKKNDQTSSSRLSRRNSLEQTSEINGSDTTKPALVCSAEKNHDKLQIANEDIRSDIERWSIEKKQDMKRILLGLSNYYIQYYQKSLAVWEDSLRKINVPLSKDC
ncbi:hypothetical protein V9T40_003706 [Parthenolecanium corni]|uniref:PX domain-containing protein n=1 Tax=Parthenolecanium corni TaxID=536013 RepID=A0AAN9YAD1_9HEMI